MAVVCSHRLRLGFSLLFKVTDDGRGTVIDLTKKHGTVEGGVGKHGGVQVRLTGIGLSRRAVGLQSGKGGAANRVGN